MTDASYPQLAPALRIDEAAEILGVSPSTLDDMVAWGSLPNIVIDGEVAISRTVLDELLDARIPVDDIDGLGVDL